MLMYSSGVYSTMLAPVKVFSAMGWSEGCLCIKAESEQSEYAPGCSSKDCQLDTLEPHRCRSMFVLHLEMERVMGEAMVEDGLRAMAAKLDIC